MARVLLIHDVARPGPDKDLWSHLETAGHQVFPTSNGGPASGNTNDFDIAVVDVGLREGKGQKIAESIRLSDQRVGILLLADASDTMQSRINGLIRGADVCEAKPVRADILSAYIEAIARRITPGAWRLDPATRILHAPRHGTLEINDREMTLLKLLAARADHCVERPVIAEAFGTDWLSYDERLLDKMVSRLRRKWHDAAACDLPLKTIHGAGYCFTEKLLVC